MAKVTESTTVLLSSAKGLLERLLGPAADEAGQMLQDSIRVYRVRNLIRVLNKTRSILSDAGVHPNAVPLRFLVPSLEHASLEDNDLLSELWAGLLASASAAGEGEISHPSFPTILAELTPQEARLLAMIASGPTPRRWHEFRADTAKSLEVTETAIDELCGNLFRLGLCAIATGPGGAPRGGVIAMRPFGKLFLKAVNGPRTKSSASTV